MPAPKTNITKSNPSLHALGKTINYTIHLAPLETEQLSLNYPTPEDFRKAHPDGTGLRTKVVGLMTTELPENGPENSKPSTSFRFLMTFDSTNGDPETKGKAWKIPPKCEAWTDAIQSFSRATFTMEQRFGKGSVALYYLGEDKESQVQGKGMELRKRMFRYRV